MEEAIRLGISTCLLGESVRYGGGHKLDRFLTETLGQYVEYVPVCREVGCGLPVPRESINFNLSAAADRFLTCGFSANLRLIKQDHSRPSALTFRAEKIPAPFYPRKSIVTAFCFRESEKFCKNI